MDERDQNDRCRVGYEVALTEVSYSLREDGIAQQQRELRDHVSEVPKRFLEWSLVVGDLCSTDLAVVVRRMIGYVRTSGYPAQACPGLRKDWWC
jgi:hypothetical protein